jgi:hypothetical protein
MGLDGAKRPSPVLAAAASSPNFHSGMPSFLALPSDRPLKAGRGSIRHGPRAFGSGGRPNQSAHDDVRVKSRPGKMPKTNLAAACIFCYIN